MWRVLACVRRCVRVCVALLLSLILWAYTSIIIIMFCASKYNSTILVGLILTI